MTTLLSIRGYGRWRAGKGLAGKSHTAVRRAISDGRLEKCLVEQDGGGFKIDPEVADEEWARNTDALQSRGATPELEGDTEGQGDLFPGAGTEVPRAPENGRSGAPALSRSQQVQALFRARLTQLEYEERSGKLCNAAEVRAEAFTKGRAVRDLLLLIPDRLSPHLAAEGDSTAIHEILLREITEALETLTLASVGATP